MVQTQIKKTQASFPLRFSQASIDNFLKYYYFERRSRPRELSEGQIRYLKSFYVKTSVVLIGGLGGFHFGPHLEKSLGDLVGGEVWSIGKGAEKRIRQSKQGAWRCGSGEYKMNHWVDEVAIVMRRILQMIEHSEIISSSSDTVIMGHSSGGLVNYALGILRRKGVVRFLKDHKKDFPNVARIGEKNLRVLHKWLKKTSLVAINTPFRGICHNLCRVSRVVIDPKIIDGVSEVFLEKLIQESGVRPIDVFEMATHSEMTPKNIYKKKHVTSNGLGSFLRVMSKIQKRGPNDGFVPKKSAFLLDDEPHSSKDLNLGSRDHRDVIEHPEVIYAILKQLKKLRK